MPSPGVHPNVRRYGGGRAPETLVAGSFIHRVDEAFRRPKVVIQDVRDPPHNLHACMMMMTNEEIATDNHNITICDHGDDPGGQQSPAGCLFSFRPTHSLTVAEGERVLLVEAVGADLHRSAGREALRVAAVAEVRRHPALAVGAAGDRAVESPGVEAEGRVELRRVRVNSRPRMVSKSHL